MPKTKNSPISNSIPYLSVIIPAYREEKFIANTLKRLADYLKTNSLLDRTEVIVVAAEGGDKTANIASTILPIFSKWQIITPESRIGKGRDVRLGMLESSADLALFMDADLATPLEHINEIISSYEKGADTIIGVREITNMHKDLIRRWTSNIANLLIRFMIDHRIKDSQCGFKAFRMSKLRIVFEKQTIMGWGFDFEILLMSKINEYKLKQIQIYDWTDPKGDEGLSGDSQIKAIASTLRELVLVKINQISGKYK